MGSGHASVVPYQALATRDGHLIVAIFAEKFWGGFCRAVEHPEWERDPRFATNRDRVAAPRGADGHWWRRSSATRDDRGLADAPARAPACRPRRS